LRRRQLRLRTLIEKIPADAGIKFPFGIYFPNSSFSDHGLYIYLYWERRQIGHIYTQIFHNSVGLICIEMIFLQLFRIKYPKLY